MLKFHVRKKLLIVAKMLLLRKLIITWIWLPVIIAEPLQATADERKAGQPQAQRPKLSKVGFSAKLTCSFSFPDRNYLVAWFKDEIHLIDHDPTVSLSLSRGGRVYAINLQDGTATLQLQNVSVKDAGKYCCKTVFTVIGKPEVHYWVLNVQDGPILKPISLSAVENETFSAECCAKFTDTTYQIKYLWSIDVSLLTTYKEDLREDQRRNPICSNVSFTAARRHHNKLLVCSIENELNSSTYARINVIYPASAEWKPPSNSMKSVIAKRYSTILITCLADGYPTPRLTLQNYDVKLTQWVNTELVPDLVQTNGTQATWRIHYNVTSNASEKLRCFAFNNVTNYEEDQGFLVETYIPAKLMLFSEIKYVHRGYDVVIKCETYGRPLPDISLQKKASDQWGDVINVAPAANNFTLYQRQVTWNFLVGSETSVSAEEYRCQANNTFQYLESDVVMINFKVTFDVFLLENLQVIICIFVASVVIIALLVTIKYHHKSRNFLPAATRYSRMMRNSLHITSGFNRAENIPDISNNQAPALPDLRNIPGFSGDLPKDQILDPYEELPCNDVESSNEEHTIGMSTEMVSYAEVQKQRSMAFRAELGECAKDHEDDYVGLSHETTQI